MRGSERVASERPGTMRGSERVASERGSERGEQASYKDVKSFAATRAFDEGARDLVRGALPSRALCSPRSWLSMLVSMLVLCHEPPLHWRPASGCIAGMLASVFMTPLVSGRQRF